jgi:hypothetical protein
VPLQNNLVLDEEEEEVEVDPEIHCLGDTSPSPHLTQSSYEKYLMDIQINELRKGEKEKENTSRYHLRSKKNEEKNDAPNQPVQKEDSAKVVIVTSKEKDSQNPQVLIKNPFPETKEILTPCSSFSFENEIKKIKIPVPFLELIKMNNLKNKNPCTKILNFPHGLIFHGFPPKKISYSKNDSPKFYRIKLFYLKNHQHFIQTI